ncbi:MAG: hypothetical protein LPK45_00715 [Bacteroidota bacterium]|nr:hypothetical protein [Bacteroidota bacterium]MDX5429546.1 hypothetical protein [Bacteroidota bacterium]MDX5468333.1 hypothetical protein [Bacteroidota bacterium]
MLSTNWLTENIIDFEYKKYILLAYLQHVHRDFQSVKLYPHLSDLVSHYRNLLDFEKTIGLMRAEEKGELQKIDLKNLELVYEKTLQNDGLMNELEEIVQYSIPQFRYHLNEGKDLYESIEHQLTLNPIGIVPLYTDEGYMLLKSNSNYETHIYQYRMTLIHQAGEPYRGIHTHFIGTETNSLIHTFEAIKRQLVKERKELPNPATYLIESEKQYPVNETLLPIARRMLVRYLYKGA